MKMTEKVAKVVAENGKYYDQKKVDELIKIVKEKLHPTEIGKQAAEDFLVSQGYVEYLALESKFWDVDQAFEKMKDFYIFRQKDSHLKLKYTDFPKEFHRTTLYRNNTVDKEGRPACFCRASDLTGPKEVIDLFQKYALWNVAHNAERVATMKKRLAIIYDCRSANINVGILRAILDYTVNCFFAGSMEYWAFVEVGFAFKMAISIIKFFLPKNLWNQIIFLNLDEVKELVDDQNLPDFMGGKGIGYSENELNKCISLEEFCKREGYDEKAIAKVVKHFKKM